MPTNSPSVYNPQTELIQPGSIIPPVNSVLSDAMPDSEATVNQNFSPDLFLGKMEGLKADSSWLKTSAYQTPINTRLKDTVRYNDPTFGFDAYNPNTEHQYGDRQGFLEKWKNNTLKFGANFIGSGLEALATIPLVIDAAATGQLNKIENNALTNNITSWINNLETELPNYETTFGGAHPVLDYIPFIGHSGDSWGGVLKNLGYTAGAIAGSLVTDMALGAISGGAADAPLIGAQFTKYSNKLGKIFAGGEEGFKAYNQALAAGKPIVQAIDSAASINNITDKIRYGIALFTSATAEAMVEANQTMTDTKSQLDKQFFDTHGYDVQGANAEAIRKTSLEAANATLIANIALLSLSNSIQFETLLKPTAVAREIAKASIDDGLVVGLKEGSKDVFEAIPDVKKGIKAYMKSIVNSEGTKSFIVEGAEEGSQYVIQTASTDYYKRKYNDESVNAVDNFIQSTAKGLHDVFTTREGLENILIGGLSGAIIHPVRSLIQKQLGFDNKNARMAQTLDLLNRNPVTGLFSDKYNAAVNAYNIGNTSTQHLQGDDLYQYKTEQFEQLFNYVNAGIKTNRFDAQIERLLDIKKLDEKNQRALLNIKDETLTKQDLDNRVDSLVDKAKEIKKDIDKVNGAFRNKYNPRSQPYQYQAYDNYKEQLAISLSQLRDNKRRIVSVGNEVSEVASNTDINKIVNLTSTEGINQTIQDFDARLKELNTDKELFKGNPKEQARVNQEIAFLEKHKTDLQENVERYDKNAHFSLISDILNYYNNHGLTEDKDDIEPFDAVTIYNKAQDIAKLYGNIDNLKKYYNGLLDKKGFDKIAAETQKANDDLRARVAAALAPLNQAPEEVVGEEIDENGNPIVATPTATATPTTETKTAPAENTVTETEAFDPDKADAEIAANAAETAKQEAEKPKAEKEVKVTAKPGDKVQFDNTEVTTEKGTKKFVSGEHEVVEVKGTGKNQQVVMKNEDGITVTIPKTEYDRLVREAAKAERAAAAQEEKPFTPATPKDEKASKNTRKYDFNPVNFFNRLFSRNFTDGGREATNMRDTIIDQSKQFIYDNMTFTVSESTRKDKITNAKLKKGEKVNAQGDVENIYHDNIYYNSYKYDIIMSVAGKPIGRLQPSDRLVFKRGDQFLPMTQLTKEEYKGVTGNDLSTYDDFMTDMKDYDDIYQNIVKQFQGGKVAFDNADVKKLFNIGRTFGTIDLAKSADTSTLLKNINYDNGNVVISLPMETDKDGMPARASIPSAIIGKERLSEEDHQKLLNYIAQNIEALKRINSRYIFITKQPDGQYTTAIAARPSQASEGALKDLIKIIQSTPKDKADVAQINAKLKENYYIADSGNTKGKGTKIFFSMSEKGDMYVNVMNGEYKRRFIVNNANKQGSISELLTRVNETLKFNATKDRTLEKLSLNIGKTDIKSGILDDENVKYEDLKDTLSVAVKPSKINKKEEDSKSTRIFENPTININPLGQRQKAAVAEVKPVATQAAKAAPKAATPAATTTQAKPAVTTAVSNTLVSLKNLEKEEGDFLNVANKKIKNPTTGKYEAKIGDKSYQADDVKQLKQKINEDFDKKRMELKGQQPEATKVETPTETKISTQMAESFLKDKEAKAKAREEAINQTPEQVENDFLKSLGCK